VRTFTDVPLRYDCLNVLVSYVKYLLLTFWPHDMAVYYPFTPIGIPAWQIVGAAFLLIVIMASCLFQRKIRPYLIVGWLWFLGTLVPVIGLVQVGGQTMADRLLLYSVNRFTHCGRVRVSGHRQNTTRCAVAQRSDSRRGSTGFLLLLRTRRFICGVTASPCLSTRSRSLHLISS